MKCSAKFKTEQDEKPAFQSSNLVLSNKPVLKLYRVGEETELQTDASRFGCGTILVQRLADSACYPIHFMSGKTTSGKEKYTSYKLEVFAIIKALRTFSLPFRHPLQDCN